MSLPTVSGSAKLTKNPIISRIARVATKFYLNEENEGTNITHRYERARMNPRIDPRTSVSNDSTLKRERDANAPILAKREQIIVAQVVVQFLERKVQMKQVTQATPKPKRMLFFLPILLARNEKQIHAKMSPKPTTKQLMQGQSYQSSMMINMPEFWNIQTNIGTHNDNTSILLDGNLQQRASLILKDLRWYRDAKGSNAQFSSLNLPLQVLCWFIFEMKKKLSLADKKSRSEIQKRGDSGMKKVQVTRASPDSIVSTVQKTLQLEQHLNISAIIRQLAEQSPITTIPKYALQSL